MKLNESVGSIDWKFYALWRGNTSNSTHICIVWSPPRWKISWSLAENADAWLKMPILHPWKNSMKIWFKGFSFANPVIRFSFAALSFSGPGLISLSAFRNLTSSTSSSASRRLVVVKNPLELICLTNKNPTTKMAHVVFQQPKYHMAHTWIFQVCKICAFSPTKNYQKAEFFTDLEDQGMYITNQPSLCYGHIKYQNLQLFPERPKNASPSSIFTN